MFGMNLSAVGALLVLGGVLILARSAGWPSLRERKNRLLRSFRTSIGGALTVVGLAGTYFYWSDPQAFLAELSSGRILGALLFFVLPLFVLMIPAFYWQYSNWDRAIERMRTRLRGKIAEETQDRRD